MNLGSMGGGAGALVQQQQQHAESSPGALLEQQIHFSSTMLKQKVFTKQTLYTVMPLNFSICSQGSKSASELQIYSLEFKQERGRQSNLYQTNFAVFAAGTGWAA